MGKRTHSDDEDYEHLAKKLKKINRKLLRARRRRKELSSSESSSLDSSSSAESDARCPPSPQQEPLSLEDAPRVVNENTVPPTITIEPQPSTSSAGQPQPSTSTAGQPQPLTSTAGQPQPTPGEFETPLNEEVLTILGDDPSTTKCYGNPIQADLAIRLQHIVTSGLNKVNRKELIEKYLPPLNCPMLDAPALNPEVKAAINENILKRDKGIELKQKQLSSAASCIATAMTQSMITKDTAIIQILMDANKLICDTLYLDSTTHRNFVLCNIKKDLRDQLQTSKIDKLLFGEDLPAAIKTAKAISRSGDDLKTIKKQPKNLTTSHRNLNWRGPPKTPARQKGNRRTKNLPAFKTRHDSYSNKSSRPAARSSGNRR